MHHRSFQPGPLTAIATACVAALLSSLPSMAVAQVEAPSAAASAPSAALPAVTVRAQSDRSRTEGTGSYTTGAMSTATRLNLSIRETPQSVSVVTRQQLDDQGILSIEDLAQSVTGLSLSRGATERGSLYSRGFQISYYTQDGLPMAASGDTLGFATLAMYDRVEVLRGASGMMNGAGNPSGTINLVRKRPTADTRVAVTGSIGRWNDYRVEVDAGGPLNAEGTLRGRAVAAAQDSDTFITNYEHQRGLVYGTLEADLAPGVLLSVGAHYNKEENPGSSWYGLATQPDGKPYPNRGQNTAPDWAYWNKSNTRFFAELEKRFDSGWKARVAAHSLRDTLDSRVTELARATTPTTDLVLSSGSMFTYDRDQTAFELSAGGPFEALGRRHEMVAGVSYRSLEQDDRGQRQNNPSYSYQFDPVNWDTGAAPLPNIVDTHYTSRTSVRQTAAYATARFSVTGPLAVLVGARHDRFENDANGVEYTVEEITPYAGVVYDLGDHWSAYGSWTRVFNPQSTKGPDDKVLDPVTGTNLEAGLKGEYFDGLLNLSAAVFKIAQENLAVSLPLDQCTPPPGQTACTIAAGEVESKGVELDMAGRLTPGWQVAAGFTYNKPEYSKDSNAGKKGVRFSPDRATRLLRVSTSYQLPGALSDWRVGGAVRAQNAVQRLNSPVRQGGYAIVDLNAGWQVNKNLDLRAGITNLLDREYFNTVGTINSGNSFGEPRSFRLTARYVLP